MIPSEHCLQSNGGKWWGRQEAFPAPKKSPGYDGRELAGEQRAHLEGVITGETNDIDLGNWIRTVAQMLLVNSRTQSEKKVPGQRGCTVLLVSEASECA